MVSKFYTPEIEEFCPGFEFEILTTDGKEKMKWFKVMYGIDPITSTDDSFATNMSRFQFLIDNEAIRVKHLDEKDMIDLGWTLSGVGDIYHPLTKIFSQKVENGFNTGVLYHVSIAPNMPASLLLDWEIYSSYGQSNGRMGLHIKNKSEFEKLFKKLNIG